MTSLILEWCQLLVEAYVVFLIYYIFNIIFLSLIIRLDFFVMSKKLGLMYCVNYLIVEKKKVNLVSWFCCQNKKICKEIKKLSEVNETLWSEYLVGNRNHSIRGFPSSKPSIQPTEKKVNFKINCIFFYFIRLIPNSIDISNIHSTFGLHIIFFKRKYFVILVKAPSQIITYIRSFLSWQLLPLSLRPTMVNYILTIQCWT